MPLNIRLAGSGDSFKPSQKYHISHPNLGMLWLLLDFFSSVNYAQGRAEQLQDLSSHTAYSVLLTSGYAALCFGIEQGFLNGSDAINSSSSKLLGSYICCHYFVYLVLLYLKAAY